MAAPSYGGPSPGTTGYGWPRSTFGFSTWKFCFLYSLLSIIKKPHNILTSFNVITRAF